MKAIEVVSGSKGKKDNSSVDEEWENYLSLTSD